MATSSIHIANGNSGYIFHNDRSNPTNNSIFKDEKNELFNDSKEALKIYRKELESRTRAYTNRTKQKLQKRVTTHLSAIVNLNQHHTLEDLKPLIQHLETSLDTKVFQVAIHRDEGHIKDGKNIKNYHCHIEFMGLDSQGYSIKQNRFKIKDGIKIKDRQRIDKTFLSQLQTKTAEVLQMERGKKNSKAKRLDTYEFKNHKQREEKALAPVLAKQKDLKQEIKLLREELKEQKATRKDYAELEQLNSNLKSKIKAKDLTLSDLQEQLTEYKDTTDKTIVSLNEDIDDLKKQLDAKPREIEIIKEVEKVVEVPVEVIKEVEVKNPLNVELQTKIERLKKDLKKAETFKQVYKNDVENLKKKLNAKPTEKVVKPIQPKTTKKPTNKGLKEEIAELKSKLQDLVPDAASPKEALKTLSDTAEKLNKASEELKELKVTKDTLLTEKEAYKQNIERLEVENLGLVSELEALKTNIEINQPNAVKDKKVFMEVGLSKEEIKQAHSEANKDYQKMMADSSKKFEKSKSKDDYLSLN